MAPCFPVQEPTIGSLGAHLWCAPPPLTNAPNILLWELPKWQTHSGGAHEGEEEEKGK